MGYYLLGELVDGGHLGRKTGRVEIAAKACDGSKASGDDKETADLVFLTGHA